MAPGMERDEVLVVGGGPAGLHTAFLLASKGIGVTVLEEHRTIGIPMQCSGLVSQRVLDFLPEVKRRDVVRNRLKGAIVYSPSGRSIRFKAPDSRAYVIDRTMFDQCLGEMALRAGADIKLGYRAYAISAEGGGFRVRYRSADGGVGVVWAKYVVGADGPNSFVSRSLNIQRGRVEFISTYQVEVRLGDNVGRGSALEAGGGGSALDFGGGGSTLKEGDMVRIYTGRHIAPGFFAWEIPLDPRGEVWRCGGGAVSGGFSHQSGRNLKMALHTHLPALRGNESVMENVSGGTIPIGLVKASARGRAALVGDAACHIKPTSGGGLYLGLRASSILAESIASSEPLERYHSAWQSEIGKEIATGLRLRRMFLSLKDRDLDDIADIINERSLMSVIETYGDIDYPWKVAWALVKKAPSLLKFAPQALWAAGKG